MCYDIEREAFLKKLEIFIRNEGKVSDSVIKIYLRKIRRLLYSEYSVGDLCGVVDQLIEDYGKGGCKFNSSDKGQTRAALVKVRNLIKGEYISTLRIYYAKSSNDVWEHKGEYVTEYLIEKEKIVIKVKGKTKKISKKIMPVNMGKLIAILQQAEQKGYIGDLYMIPTATLLIDSPSSCTYEYSIGDVTGTRSGSLFGEGNEKARIDLTNMYYDLIDQLIYPYSHR